jgi:hypothetical protein
VEICDGILRGRYGIVLLVDAAWRLVVIWP